MHILFLNPQGNFDSKDSYWTEHPDFGGQLVYVKEIALAIAAQGHKVDIVARRITDEKWPKFAAQVDAYPNHPNVRIVRIPCGPPQFLAKEELWPYLGTDWVQGIIDFYTQEGRLPDVVTTHYGDGGLAGAVLKQKTGIPFTFTGHSLGAQKMDKLHVNRANLAEVDARYQFRYRIMGERISMNHAARIITSTRQEQLEQYSHLAYRQAIDVAEPDGTRFAVIPPGVNRQVFSPEPQAIDGTIQERIVSAMRRDLAADRLALPLVICSSRLDRKKNHLGLVRAFVESAELRATANLGIAIRGLENPLDDRAKLKDEEKAILDEIVDLLEQHGLRQVVTSFSLNSQAELASAYRVGASKHCVFSLTALYEPFGLAPMEAMSCGLPAVVTCNGGPAESLYDSQTQREYGVLVDPANPTDIARGLLKVFASPESWQKYHDAGIERVITRYTWESTAKGYLAAIEEVAAGKVAPRSVR